MPVFAFLPCHSVVLPDAETVDEMTAVDYIVADEITVVETIVAAADSIIAADACVALSHSSWSAVIWAADSAAVYIRSFSCL